MEPAKFVQQLASRNQYYELLSKLPAQTCHFRFSGPFQGSEIVWDAYLQTLSYYVNKHAGDLQSSRQFIEVGDSAESGRLIQIGLNLPVIDETVILKTLIMIRQYKRLAPGRHEFGECVNFSK
jgi:hypothetical protein